MAGTKTLEQILGLVPLTGTIQATKTGVPMPLPEKFMTIVKPTIGDSGRYTQVTGQRRTAKLAMYGAPAVRRELKNVAVKDVKLIHSFEEISLNPLVLQQLRNYNNYDIQRMGMEEVARQVAEFKQLFVNLRATAILQALANGVLYFDGSGNLLPTSSGAVVTVSFGMSANNQNQLNGIIGATWDSGLTDIPAQLRLLKKTARQLTGYPLKYAFYGENVPSYITNNDYCSDYLSRNSKFNGFFSDSGELADGLFGFTWVPVYEAFYEDFNSTNQAIFGANSVTFTPEPDPGWWEVQEGTYIVPSTINIITDANAALASARQVQGMFGYGAMTHNPPTIQMYFGDTFLGIPKVPDALFQATVKF